MPCFSSITYKYSLCPPRCWQRTRGVGPGALAVGCAASVGSGGSRVCLTPWPSARAGAAQQPEPPAATPAPSCRPRVHEAAPQDQPRNHRALLGGAVPLGKENGPSPDPGAHAEVATLSLVFGSAPSRGLFPPSCTAQALSLGASALALSTPCAGHQCAQPPVPCGGVSAGLRAGHRGGDAGARVVGQTPQPCSSR